MTGLTCLHVQSLGQLEQRGNCRGCEIFSLGNQLGQQRDWEEFEIISLGYFLGGSGSSFLGCHHSQEELTFRREEGARQGLSHEGTGW